MTDLLVQEALKKAKYNEAVIVTVAQSACISDKNSDDDENDAIEKNEIVLIPALDFENGGIIWKDACSASTSSSLDLDIGIMRHLRTKKWVVPMLNDTLRNKLYDESIYQGCRKAIENLLAERNEKHNLRILDIGSGTGLLAMMTARYSLELAREYQSINKNSIDVEVHSVEMASAMARLARKTIESNSLDEIIKITEAHSCDESFSPFLPPNKANLCTSELLESSFLGEGIIPAMRDAWQRHLSKDAIVIPPKARVYAQVIESTWMTNYKGPLVTNGFNLSPSCDPNNVLLDGNIIIPIHSESIFSYSDDSGYLLGRAPSDGDRVDYARKLSDPILTLEFDFTSLDSIPLETGSSIKREVKAIDHGTAHGILFWWELDLGGSLYSTRGEDHWQDHWQQCVFVFNSDSYEKELKKDEKFELICKHDDYSISFQISKQLCKVDDKQNKQKRQKIVTQETSNYISFERALQLNDTDRLSVFSQAIKLALDTKGLESCVLDVSDFSLCSLIAAKQFGAKSVTSIESSCGDTPMLSAMVTQIGNQLPEESCQFQIINAHLESLCIDHLNGQQVDVIMSENYYEILQGWNLPCALNYYNITKALKKKGLVKDSAISVPSKARVKCCAIEFSTSVTESHCGLKHENGSICNFKHEDAILYSQTFHNHDIILPLWQYKWKPLSDIITLAEINYEGDVSSMCITGDREWSEMIFSSDGLCWAIAHWVDYGFRVHDGPNDSFVNADSSSCTKTISSGNRYNYQSIRMLPSPITIRKDDVGLLRLAVKPCLTCKDIDDYNFEVKVVTNNS